MKQHKVLIFQNDSEDFSYSLEKYLNEGWKIERTDSPHIAYGGNSYFAYYLIYILSKE